jgi:hypothetical protein
VGLACLVSCKVRVATWNVPAADDAVTRSSILLNSSVNELAVYSHYTYHFGANAVTVKRADGKGTKVPMTWVD